MSVKDDILQRKRAQRAHARGLTDQVRPEPAARPGPILPENETELDAAMRPTGAIDTDLVYAKWNRPKKRRAEAGE